LVAAFSLPVAAQLFKCTAADGKVAYQDSPCPTTAAQKQMSQIQSDVRDAAASGVALMDVDAAARAFGESRGSVAVLVIYSSRCATARGACSSSPKAWGNSRKSGAPSTPRSQADVAHHSRVGYRSRKKGALRVGPGRVRWIREPTSIAAPPFARGSST